MKSNCYRRSVLFSMLAVLPLCLVLILLATPSANAAVYVASEESSYFGNLAQPYPINTSNPYVCGQTSLVNALVYLQNKYPGTYGTSLVPSSMEAVATNLNNNYIPTTWSDSKPSTSYGTLAWGTWQYVKDQGQLPNTYFYAETTSMSNWRTSWVTSAPTNATGIAENPTCGFLYNALINGDAVVIGWISASGQHHYMTLTAINFDSSTGAGTISYLDPIGGGLYNVPIYGNSDGTIGFFYSNRAHPWYTGDVAVKMALVFGPTPLSSMDPPGVPPPTPDPMTWATAPYSTGTTSIAMVATTATDPTTPISYYFDFVDSPTGGTGGADLNWQSSTSYTNSGLGVNHQYGYQVKARDGANNETAYSTPTRYVYTTIETPSGITFGTVTSTSIQVQSTNTPSGLNRGSSGLLIENTTNSTNSGWKQDNSFWTSNPLTPNTSYSFRAKARNGDSVETGYCSPVSKYTLANAPGAHPFSNVTQSCIRANWAVNGNPAGTQYFCENTTAGTNSGWITATSWDSCGLSHSTSYNFRVKAKNVEEIETNWISLGYHSPVHSFPFFDDFSMDKGWIEYGPGGWERGPATAGGGENGYSDPETDYTASLDNYILGFAIGADYSDDLTEEGPVISPPIDCTGQDQVFLKFKRYLNVESSRPEPNVEGDHARIYVGTNGTDWTKVWENPPIDLMDNQWMPVVLDISSIAANQATVYIKFTMGPTNSSRRFSGWNIDDFEVTSEAIYPSEGTLGTELEIRRSNFGAKKGKVLVGITALTVIDWGNDLIHSRLTKVLTPGVYDITIQPVEPTGVLPIVEKAGFVVKAPEIHSIEQGEGTANDQVTIKGKYFGTKKGAVYLEYGEGENLTRKSCKVSGWTMDPKTGDSEIVFVVPKMLPEVCDVVVDPSGIIPETEEEDGFAVKAPGIESVNPGSGSVAAQITISGNFFGSKKGKVYLGYVSDGKTVKKSCSVVSWVDDEIVFTVPNVPAGTYDVIVTNSVSSTTLSGGFVIE